MFRQLLEYAAVFLMLIIGGALLKAVLHKRQREQRSGDSSSRGEHR